MKIAGMMKLGVILALFAAAACVMLAFVYTGTAAIIEQRQQADLHTVLRDIFPDAHSFEPIIGMDSPYAPVTIQSAYAAMIDGNVAGAALRVSRAGYSGPIVSMVGINSQGIITGVRILEHTETPGLGANAISASYFVNRANGITFFGQFTGKSTGDPFEVNNDVIIITASTITSHAVASSVRAAGMAATAWLSGLENITEDAASGATEGGLH